MDKYHQGCCPWDYMTSFQYFHNTWIIMCVLDVNFGCLTSLTSSLPITQQCVLSHLNIMRRLYDDSLLGTRWKHETGYGLPWDKITPLCRLWARKVSSFAGCRAWETSLFFWSRQTWTRGSHTLSFSVISHKNGILSQSNRSAAAGYMCGPRAWLAVEGEANPTKFGNPFSWIVVTPVVLCHRWVLFEG